MGDRVADKEVETPQVEGLTPWPTGLRVIEEKKKKKDEEKWRLLEQRQQQEL